MLASLESDTAHHGQLTSVSSRRRFLAAAFMIPALSVLPGCGKSDVRVETFPVTGSLKFDGKAPAGAKLVFHPLKIEGETLGAAPNARVKNDGSFSVSSYKQDDGAPPGEYAVTVEWYKVDDQGAPGPNIIPPLYSSPTTSPIKVTVSAGGPTTLEPITISSKTAARPGVIPARR